MKSIICIFVLCIITFASSQVCGVDPDYRVDCGWVGISRGTCDDRDCCWDETYDDAPWCFKRGGCGHSKGERRDCGYLGISASQCRDKGCCWSERYNDAPWCYWAK